jgi:GNAT superfamily N-acetyltransferase
VPPPTADEPGTASVRRTSAPADHVVYKLYIHPDHRGRGLGPQLLDSARGAVVAHTHARLCQRFVSPVIGPLACEDIRVGDMQAIVNAAPTSGEGRRACHRLPFPGRA